jgi:hypothetical protein
MNKKTYLKAKNKKIRKYLKNVGIPIRKIEEKQDQDKNGWEIFTEIMGNKSAREHENIKEIKGKYIYFDIAYEEYYSDERFAYFRSFGRFPISAVKI